YPILFPLLPILCRISFLRDSYLVWGSYMMKYFLRRQGATLAAVMIIAFAPEAAQAQCGSASWYALTSKTASGERMNPSALTAAHRNLPFGTKVKVINRRNGKAIVVRINDRGPFVRGRILD